MLNNRGSEWNRWDFHIHTPCTKKNDNFTGKNDTEKWGNFYSDIIKYIGDKSNPQTNIVAMGVTDYLSIDNYNKIINDGILTEKIDFIFPNVELRITPIAKCTPINMHCLFDPQIASTLNDDFFAKLSIDICDNSYTASKSNLIKLSKLYDAELDDAEAYKKGLDSFIIPIDVLKKLFNKNKELRDHTIIAISNNSKDGASGLSDINDSQLSLVRNDLYTFSDLIFSAKQSDIDYFLGLKKDTIDQVCSKCGSLKACVNGCDAHQNSKIFEPDNKRYCWIKSIPSFNGIKEILLEPHDRVRIQELQPETKPSYNIIDKIVIEDNEDFSDNPILFNDKLTCIIGGKSTGKSLLLHNIAHTIDPIQVDEKLKKTHASYYQINNMKVYWSNGQISTLDTPIDKKIVYIPQSYLNNLTDNPEETNETDQIVLDILLQNNQIKDLFDKHNSDIAICRQEINTDIHNLCYANSLSSSLRKEKSEIGDKLSIEKEINDLNKQKDIYIKNNSLSSIDIDKYEKNLTTVSKYQMQLKALNKDKSTIANINSIIEPIILPDIAIRKISDSLFKAQVDITTNAGLLWNKAKENLIKNIENTINDITKKQEALLIDNSKLEQKIKINKTISKISESIRIENEKLIRLDDLTKNIDELDSKKSELINNISSKCMNIIEIHEKFVDDINKIANNSNTDSLVFSTSLQFKHSLFIDSLTSFIDNRKLTSLISKDENNEYLFFANDYDAGFIEKAINKCLDNSLNFVKKGKSDEDAIRSIANDWYNISYSIKEDNDEIQQMSPGKKALVLLKLIIDLAESTCPILIDQPEDDLDNRSIYNELVNFIKQKKIDRQIILVTHNANIVVGCDAEEIIIANQDGANTPNNKYRFEYRSGAIEEINPIFNDKGKVKKGVLNQKGIQQHICEILEGGKEAFNTRKNKYTTNN